MTNIEKSKTIIHGNEKHSPTFIQENVLTEQGDVIYASATSTPAALAHGTAGDILKSGGHGDNPSWLTTLPVANGGTGDTGTAWTAFTPTLNATDYGGVTSITNVASAWKSIGKTVYFRIRCTCAYTGAKGTYWQLNLVGLPSAVVLQAGVTGYTNVGCVTGYFNANTVVCQRWDLASGPINATGDTLYIKGVFESV